MRQAGRQAGKQVPRAGSKEQAARSKQRIHVLPTAGLQTGDMTREQKAFAASLYVASRAAIRALQLHCRLPRPDASLNAARPFLT